MQPFWILRSGLLRFFLLSEPDTWFKAAFCLKFPTLPLKIHTTKFRLSLPEATKGLRSLVHKCGRKSPRPTKRALVCKTSKASGPKTQLGSSSPWPVRLFSRHALSRFKRQSVLFRHDWEGWYKRKLQVNVLRPQALTSGYLFAGLTFRCSSCCASSDSRWRRWGVGLVSHLINIWVTLCH